MENKTLQQSEMLRNRVVKNMRRLKSYLKAHGVNAYRLYDRDIPEMPLAIDWYNGRLHISEFQNDYADESRRGAEWVGDVTKALCEYLNVGDDQVFFKSRQRNRGKEQYTKLGDFTNRFTVDEMGCKFLVDLENYTDTGLFLDHRPLRRTIQEHSQGKDFLNLFSYTGSFTVHAIKGGSKSTMSVDLSPTYQLWTKDNFALNDIEENNKNRLINGDVMSVLVGLQKNATKFDCIVIDPPTFSNSKKLDEDFEIERSHEQLLELASKLLRPEGTLYFSTNKKRFTLKEPFASSYINITEQTIPPDFRQKRPHGCWQYRCPSEQR